MQLIKDPDIYSAIRESRTSCSFLISFIKELGNQADANLRASGTVPCPGQALGNTQVNVVEPGRICVLKDIFVKAVSVAVDYSIYSLLIPVQGGLTSTSHINFI